MKLEKKMEHGKLVPIIDLWAENFKIEIVEIGRSFYLNAIDTKNMKLYFCVIYDCNYPRKSLEIANVRSLFCFSLNYFFNIDGSFNRLKFKTQYQIQVRKAIESLKIY